LEPEESVTDSVSWKRHIKTDSASAMFLDWQERKSSKKERISAGYGRAGV